MDARRILTDLRSGKELTDAQITWFADGLASGAVTDAQAGAFAMAVLLRGLGETGRVALTRAMAASGARLTWDLPGPVVDKHSTGGIGDCVSLVLAPALAACGAFVPMISGRGLGHTGGTLDKLEAIPGLKTTVDKGDFQQIVGQHGFAIVSASDDVAPADRRLYSVRDITATVESLDLITASILSKKLAAGLDALVLDIKAGSGAFMATDKDAFNLARALVDTANGAGCATQAIVSDMSQPLAPAAGNALEVSAAMRVLCGEVSRDPLSKMVIELGAALLHACGLAPTKGQGRKLLEDAIASGRAVEKFDLVTRALGGPPAISKSWNSDLPKATVIRPVPAPTAGYVNAIDGRAIGMAVVDLGGGRRREDDTIDPSVGLSGILRIGTHVPAGAPLAWVHAASDADAEAAIIVVRNAFLVGPDKGPEPPLLRGEVTA
ncbi:MAG: thymidine phosphorylase [Pseudomonadota bacterium]